MKRKHGFGMKGLFTFILCISAFSLSAQNITVRGTVTDKDNEPLIGATVVVEGNTSQGTVTDIDGKYELPNVRGNANLVFSYVGMKAQTVAVNGRTTIDVVLDDDAEMLDEVVVTALGLSREKKALGYAVTEIKSDNLSAIKDNNPVSSLTGKVPGIVISQSGAGIGSGSRVIIRGNNSISANNQPLIVLDGIPLDNTGENSGGDVYESKVSGGGISDINPEDIESISVLKGPNAAALYGSRAGNGVILITTKKGSMKKGLGISVNSNITFDSPMTLPKYQNEYGQGTQGFVPANVIDLKNESGSWGAKLDGSEQLYYTGEKRAYSAVNNNVRDFFRTGTRYINSVALESGSDKYNVRFSYTNNSTQSILPESNLKNNTFNLRAFANLTDKFNIDAKVTYFIQDMHNQPSVGSQGIMAYVLTMPRNIALSDLRNYQDLTKGYNSLSYSSLGANPYWMLLHDRWDQRKEHMLGFVKATYQFTPYLSAFARVGTDITGTKTESVNQYGHHFKKTGALNFNKWRSSETNADFLIMFDKRITEKFNLAANFGGNHSYRTYEYSGISGEDFKIPTRATVANLRTVNPPSYTPLEEKTVNSLYLSASLSYANFLYLDLTARNDWSSTLPAQNRSYSYPSISTSVVLSEAFRMPQWVDFLKLRGSWAQVGNDTSPYQIFEYYNLAGDGYLGTTQVSKLNVKLNPNLRPEKIASAEAGLEFRLWKNRFYGDFSIYDIKTTDLIFDVDVAKATGYDKFRENIGEMQNKGVELMLGVIPVQTKDFTWDVSMNFSKNKNTLNKLTEDLKNIEMNKTNSGNVVVQATVGGGYGDIYGTDWKKNEKGEIVLNSEGKPLASSEKIYLGNAQPKWLGGITNTLIYKNLSLRFLIDGRFGGEIYAQTNAALDGSGVSERSLQYRDGGIKLNGVIENSGAYTPNDKTITAEQYWGNVSGIASEYIYKQTNVRLREFALSYSLPKNLLHKTFIEGASLSLIGRNLFFFYKELPDFDPESSLGTSNRAMGIASYNLPVPRSIGFNINLKF